MPDGRRRDLQALRGWAVTIVILFHAGLGVLPSGYLGVDMFFVLSGYLITGIILRDRAAGKFRFGQFYLRRARRLLPAAYAMLALTIVAAMLLLTRSFYARFLDQLAGALTMSINMVLWRQINYFHDSAIFEPLLHMWSLAVEEQFYLLMPALLVMLPPRRWTAVLAVATAVSLIAYLVAYPRAPAAAFYLLPLRAWELGLGAVAATSYAERARVRDWATRLRPLALLALLALPLAPTVAALVPWLTLFACISAVAFIVAEPWEVRALTPWAAIGDRSYSLYLAHWPLFAFANIVWLGMPLPPLLIGALLLATATLGWASYRWIERPGQVMPLALRRISGLAAAGAGGLALLGAIGAQMVAGRGQPFDTSGVTGLPLAGCEGTATRFDGRCSQSPQPRILLWGDSFSQHLVPAITASTRHPIAQASLGGCAPLLGIAPVDRLASRRIAAACIGFNDSVLAYLARTPSIELVVLSGRYLRYITPDTRGLLSAGDNIVASTPGRIVAAQARTSAAIRAIGRRVVVVSGPPQARFDVGQCWERKLAGLPHAGARADCAITPASAHVLTQPTARLLDAFAHTADTPVLRIDRAMCANRICPTAWNNVPLYRDNDHLGEAGSRLVGRRLGLGERLWAMAR
ncbi:acyltransferase family protein [Sphingomonas qomolangmaensis]|uniref:Acyltransferase n=1 Tax=Sphingomonas qomolangmaensis TaxID=2918765 RepID=A0ABY5L9M2_9SPHN|nr:acyltransferase family protein [Sphingomonas qomolangmaensis]UUL82470.1 acyltransferase [Sphingomonas qomolangmaensis]